MTVFAPLKRVTAVSDFSGRLPDELPSISAGDVLDVIRVFRAGSPRGLGSESLCPETSPSADSSGKALNCGFDGDNMAWALGCNVSKQPAHYGIFPTTVYTSVLSEHAQYQQQDIRPSSPLHVGPPPPEDTVAPPDECVRTLSAPASMNEELTASSDESDGKSEPSVILRESARKNTREIREHDADTSAAALESPLLLNPDSLERESTASLASSLETAPPLCLFQGYLQKAGPRTNLLSQRYKKRYFRVLRPLGIYYAKSESAKEPLGFIPREGIKAVLRKTPRAPESKQPKQGDGETVVDFDIETVGRVFECRIQGESAFEHFHSAVNNLL